MSYTKVNIDEIKEKELTIKRWYGICNFNQTQILMGFFKELCEKYSVYIDDLCFKPCLIGRQDQLEGKTVSYNDFSNYLKFIISDYQYYVQLDTNPLFENSSYFTANKIITNKNGNKCCREIYGGGYNLNHLFGDIYSIDCDIKAGIANLMEYFENKVFEKQSELYIKKCKKDPDQRVFPVEIEE